MEDTIILKNDLILNKEITSLRGSELLKKITRGRISLIIIFITMMFGFTARETYAQVKIDNNQEQKLISGTNSKKDNDESENLEQFTVGNNVYKVLETDKNCVMFYRCEKVDDSQRIIINNEVDYDGNKYKVIYIYEKALAESVKTEKSITVDNGILGFCDLKGNPIQILKRTFLDHRKLENINFSNDNFIFGENCFQNCKALVNINIPKNMTIIESYCFDKCASIESIDLKEITKFNGNSCFANCTKLKDIGEFNDKATELPDKTFISCNNLRIKSLKNIIKLGNECFEYCKVLNPNIITDVEEIGDECFLGCSFNEVYLKKVKKIGANAFGSCGALTKIRFGSPTIPIIEDTIVKGGIVNDWIYPLNYKNQSGYLEFLNKLRISKVTWNSNYGNQEKEVTQAVKLGLLEAPSFIRDGYEIEGWYCEPECINKVYIVADFAKITGSDLEIKNPELYAKWKVKENNSDSGSGEVDTPPPSNPNDTGSGEVDIPPQSDPNDSGSGEVDTPPPSDPNDSGSGEVDTPPPSDPNDSGSGEVDIPPPSNPNDSGSGEVDIPPPSNPNDSGSGEVDIPPPSNPNDSGSGEVDIPNPSNPSDTGNGEINIPKQSNSNKHSENKKNYEDGINSFSLDGEYGLKVINNNNNQILIRVNGMNQNYYFYKMNWMDVSNRHVYKNSLRFINGNVEMEIECLEQDNGWDYLSTIRGQSKKIIKT